MLETFAIGISDVQQQKRRIKRHDADVMIVIARNWVGTKSIVSGFRATGCRFRRPIRHRFRHAAHTRSHNVWPV